MRRLLPILAVVVAALAADAQTPIDTGITLVRAGRVFDSERGVFLPA